MTNTVRLKRGSGSDPSASDMVVGEPVIRTDTAELFFKKDDGSVAKVSGGGGGPDFKYLALRNAANNGSASYPGNDFTLVTSGTTTAISPAAANTLLVSYGGVIQKPNSGTSTSGITGFIVDGSRIKTATNFAAAPDFILYQESGGIGEPSDDTVTNAKVTSNAAIAGTKISPNFGSQNIVTTGTLGSGDLTLSGANPIINFTDTNNDSDFRIQVEAGTFLIEDTTNSYADRFRIASDGTVDVFQNLNVGAGLDVTGNVDINNGTGQAHYQITQTNGNTVKFGIVSGSDIELSGSANNSMYFKTNNTERFRIAGDGKIYVGGTTASHTIGEMWFNDTSAYSSVIKQVGGSSALTFHTGQSQPERLRIDSGGRLLVGSTTHNTTLDVARFHKASGHTSLSLTCGSNSDVGFHLKQSTREWKIFSDGNLRFYDLTDNAERLRIKSDGKVGIGTASPESLLSVDGSVAISSNNVTVSPSGFDLKIRSNTSKLGIHTDTAGGTPILELGTGGSTGGQVFTTGTNPLRLGVNSGENMRIHGDGKVGIGTTSPNRILSVKGNGGQMSIIDDDDSKMQFYCNSGTGSIWATGGGGTNGSLDFATTPSGGSTTSRMQISASGYVTKPSQPNFLTYGTNSDGSANNSNFLNIGNTYHNVGNDYNTSNGRFTCPVTGIYFFYCSWTPDNSTSSPVIYFFVNGSQSQVGALNYNSQYAGTYLGQCFSLSANDYVQCSMRDWNNSIPSPWQTWWGGYLLQ